MRKTEQTPEPSIEEILASIRKIIADDGEPTAGPAFDPYNKDSAGNQARDAGPAEPVTDPDVPISKVTTVAKPITDYEQGHAPVPSGNAMDARRNDEILELTDDCLLEELENLHASAPAHTPAYEAAKPEVALAVAAVQEEITALSPTGAPDAYNPEQTLAGSANPDIPPLPTEQELAEFNDVISNVVAEMQRVNDLNEAEPEPGPSADFMPAMPEPKSAASATSATQGGMPSVPAPPKAPVTPARKPAWSARNRTSAAKAEQTSAADAESTKSTEAADGASAKADVASESPSPLMEAIATSLVTALADSNERQEKNASNVEADAETAATAPKSESASVSEQEPLPEEAFAPDMDDVELASSTVSSAPADVASVKETSTAPQAADDEPPELPGEDISSASPSSASAAQSDAAHESDAPPVVSIATASLASAAPEATSANVNDQQAALPAGLDDGVNEMLKPMLAAWLDENLPRLVEKALSDELAKRDLPKTE